MARINVKGIPAYNGEYHLDTERQLNGLEWRWIKRISGYMPLTIGEGFAGQDPDLFIALAVVAMRRDGKIEKDDALRVAELISDSYGVEIELEDDPVEAEEVPLDSTPPHVELLRTGSP